MFEQSLLLDDAPAKKTAAFAASLTAQIAFTGVCILIPLVYQEALPMVKPALALPVFIKALPVAPREVETRTMERPRITTNNVFRPPIAVPTRSPQPET